MRVLTMLMALMGEGTVRFGVGSDDSRRIYSVSNCSRSSNFHMVAWIDLHESGLR